jgi:hypothetical protein
MVGIKYQLSGILGQTCLWEGTIPTTLEGEGPAEAVVTRLQSILANSERIIRNSGLCPERIEFRGTFSPTRQTLRLSGGAEECRSPPRVIAEVSETAIEDTRSLEVSIPCERTRIRAISTRRPEVIAATDPERAIGREFRRETRFLYTLTMRDQPGMETFTDEVLIETNFGNARTRVTFRNQ